MTRCLVTTLMLIAALALMALPDPARAAVQESSTVDQPRDAVSEASDADSDDDPQTSDSEDNQGEETSPPEDVAADADFERFMDLIQERATNTQRISQLMISMPIGFSDQQKMMKAEIATLRRRNVDIVDEIHAAAIASFEKFPNTRSEVTNYLLQHLQKQLTANEYIRHPFNPVAALRSFQQLSDGGVTQPVLHLLGYRTFYVLNDFDQAEQQLKLAAQLEPNRDYRQPFQDLQRTQEIWEKEQAYRTADEEKENPRVQIEMDCGTMVVELYEDNAPNTVANFITLVEDGFYNGLLFYQVDPTRVAITGSPSNDGRGGPGYDTRLETDVAEPRHHFTGVLSMFTNGEATHGSRFLITKQPMLAFDGRSTPFGRIVEGLENLYNVKVVNRTAAVSANDRTQPTQIIRMTVLRKRDHEYVAERATPETTLPSGG